VKRKKKKAIGGNWRQLGAIEGIKKRAKGRREGEKT